MRDDVVFCLNSFNEHITGAYDLSRLRLATILRDIYRVRESTDDMTIYMTLSELSKDLREADVLANGTLERLVRDDLITGGLATSLINDSSFASHISGNLSELARRMFIAQGTDLKEVEAALLTA